MIKRQIVLFVFFFLICNANWAQDSLLYQILKRDTSAVVQNVMNNPEAYHLQLIFSEVESGQQMVDHSLNYHLGKYYYPASFIKIPAALLALEKLDALEMGDSAVYLEMKTNPLFGGVHKDSIFPDMEQTLEELLVLSDNSAFNRLYDFIGYEYANLVLFSKGYTQTRLIQRLYPGDKINHKVTGPFQFRKKDSVHTVVYSENEMVSSKDLKHPLEKPSVVGKAYMYAGKKWKQPRDFSKYNYMPMVELHTMMKSIFFPEYFSEEKRFKLKPASVLLLRNCLKKLPMEMKKRDVSKDTIYGPNFRKYFFVGGSNKVQMDTSLVLYNKVAMAYGYLGDCAYVEDRKSGKKFFLSCMVYCNKDEILNDNRYEYNSIGFPFLKRVSEILLDYVRNKKE